MTDYSVVKQYPEILYTIDSFVKKILDSIVALEISGVSW